MHDGVAPVEGGSLAYAEWAPGAGGTPILAVHGITANSRTWPVVAARLPGVRIVAPDLRGRARSNALPAPYDFAQHVDDLVRLLDDREIDRAVVLGHSMGAFVSVLLAATHPDRVRSLVLVDGGLALPIPPGVDRAELPRIVLGPALERLSQMFPSREAYREFWRAHPALGPWWNDAIQAYVDYDAELIDGGPAVKPSPNPVAIAASAAEIDGGDAYAAAFSSLALRVDWLRAPRGLLNVDPLYAPGVLDAAAAGLPNAAVTEVEDVNHYTIVLADAGVDAVVGVVRRHLAA